MPSLEDPPQPVIAMSQNLLPVEDFSDAPAVPSDAGEGAQGLHARLQTAFAPAGDDVATPDSGPAMSATEATRALAAATLRQGRDFENFQERIVRLEHGPDVGAIRENVRDLCEALLHITVENKKYSAEIDNRFESLADALAALSGHVASHRQELQANVAATAQLSGQVLQLRDELASQRAETAQLKELLLSNGQSLRDDLEAVKDRIAPLGGSLQSQERRIDAVEGHVASQGVRLDTLEPGAAKLADRVDALASESAALAGRVGDLEPLKNSFAQLAAEDAKLVERIGLVTDDLDQAKTQLAGLEDAAAALADTSIRSADRLSVLGNALEAAKTQISSLNETSEYLTDRLRIAEQVIDTFTRREKILAGLHARAARTLQVGQ